MSEPDPETFAALTQAANASLEQLPLVRECRAEIERLRARIVELEAALGIAHGTLAAAEPEDDQPWQIEHDAPGNVPR